MVVKLAIVIVIRFDSDYNSFFQIRTLGGELVRIVRQENNVKFLTNSTEANLRASNIETAFGLVQVIDSVL